MKIALMGASGTGKTTLAKEISKKYDIPYLEKISGFIFEEIVEDKKNPLKDKKNNALYKLSNCICRMNDQLTTKSYVADRSVLDSYMYISLDFDFSYKSQILEFLIYCIKNNPYDLLIYVPMEFELPDTEKKPRLDLGHRMLEDKLAKTIFEKFKNEGIAKKCIKVSGNVMERMNQISNVIKKLTK